ncbi:MULTISPECIES: DUF3693 domain-containing protein [unclassified Caballeronia]|uniref:DUF3693 domain-containing protein n=1 Tax=unclassified Caballeronia TaxID=2646786 RepID=UPI0020285CF9|nr:MULTISPECIES: DUF3693 domain-containing protein [unclassified Caballeronia]
MKTSSQYLDAAKTELDLPSDYALAKALGVTPSTISKYRLGRSAPDDLVCARIAEILSLEPMEVIAAVHYERSTDERARELWSSIWGKAAGAIATSSIVFAVCFGTIVPTPSQAASLGDNQRNDATLCVM